MHSNFLKKIKTSITIKFKFEDNFSVLLRPEVQKSVSSLNEAIELILREPQQLERPFVIDAQHKKAALGRPDLSGIEALIANL
ncbi:hypothetical protein G6F35_017786 [Rhizopus arrhizus]|nr:hypothetical protein G6F35_017786 [Rhizopus arrhizus]